MAVKHILVAAALISLAACGHMPTHSTNTADEAPTLDLVGAAPGTTVYVDGQMVGTVTEDISKFTAPAGTHAVRVIDAMGRVLYDGDLYFTKNITRSLPVS
ncbi:MULTISPECIES: hypothetical protein [Kordiimonas]|jgi:hypothetical protein|uniref:hypothetical protein n=1 Tax=Kordiimonas TaxID=288021 RepID=UPI00257EE2A2|nr:hypothetical protein [Kordiimonas sp. UBA4487]